MKGIEAFVLLGTAASTALAAESVRPRGVGPDFAKYYKGTETFACISNPDILIAASRVNDDYCDCPDGSDEPGTSACSFLSPLSPPQLVPGTATGTSNTTLALPGFYCKNKGHRPEYIPFTYVNDGVCDYERCCDGSDEWAGVGGVKCEDKCRIIGMEWKRTESERVMRMIKAGKKRAELIAEAGDLRGKLVEEIDGLEREIGALEERERNLKADYEDIERKEKGRVVKTAGKGNKVTVLAGLAKARIEELREALVGVKGGRDEAREKVKELEAILSAFKEEYNPNFNDEGVKRAVKAWEDYAAAKASGEAPNDAADRDIDEIAKPDGENGGIQWEEWENGDEEESDTDALYRFEEYLPESIRAWVHDRITDLRSFLIENGVLPEPAGSGSESNNVKKAREAYQSVSDALGAKTKTVGERKEDLGKNYGPEDIFRALKGVCVSKDAGEYTYELCWMGKISQKSKKGHSQQKMGDFTRLDTITVDEEMPTDGKGLGSGERLALVYENGSHCWNGPNRRTTVVLACAETDEIWKVVEEEKCVYRMEVGSPAACDEQPERGAKKTVKDEL